MKTDIDVCIQFPIAVFCGDVALPPGTWQSIASTNKVATKSRSRQTAEMDGEPRRQLQMTDAVYREIERTVGSRRAEHGGMLGGSREDSVIRHYYFDHSARQTGATYSPDHETLNTLLSKEWNPGGVNLLGFVHSHPNRLNRPSGGDEIYARRILEAIPDLDQLLIPIVLSEPDTGRFEIFPYAAVRNGGEVRIELLDLVIVDGPQENFDRVNEPLAGPADQQIKLRTELPLGFPLKLSGGRSSVDHPQDFDRIRMIFQEANGRGWCDTSETFRRVRGAYDLDRMARSRVIYGGVGGAAAFAEDMARAGIGEHILIDPDIVSETNLATQQAYRRDIGRPKVECIADRICDINPNAVVLCVQKSLDDIDDLEFRKLSSDPLQKGVSGIWGAFHGGGWYFFPVDRPPAQTLVCGLTDNFPAQARVNRLALHLGLPSLCAQVYVEGRGAEVTFTHPEETPACHRCALASRYKEYVQNNFQNNVTSDGTPIFSTTRLNALKGYIALALLHHGSDHPRWGDKLSRIGSRNLVQIRLDPDFKLPAFSRVFEGADSERIFCDDVVWLPQKPDCPENGFPRCPDCGGSGMLISARGKFTDTRIMLTNE